MPYLIGMDEAGYGPNLGPLVISATRWRVDGDGEDLYATLAGLIARAASPAGDVIAMADSKTLYRRRQGLRLLERGVLAALVASHGPVADPAELWHALGADRAGQRERLPWFDEFRRPVPVACTAAGITRLAEVFRRGCAASDVRLETIQARAIFPEHFNTLVDQFGTKSTALSRAAMTLLGEVLPSDHGARVLVVCDKHGGRNRYAELLANQFPHAAISVCHEGRAESAYRWGTPRAEVEIRFATGGEAFLPAALASMTAKYLRELAMLAENHFWCQRVDGLRPTAGYPVDARRFMAEIADCQRRLAIPDRIVWRVK